MAKVTLVPCSVNLTSKRDKVGHGKVTINNALIIKIGYAVGIGKTVNKQRIVCDKISRLAYCNCEINLLHKQNTWICFVVMLSSTLF